MNDVRVQLVAGTMSAGGMQTLYSVGVFTNKQTL